MIRPSQQDFMDKLLSEINKTIPVFKLKIPKTIDYTPACSFWKKVDVFRCALTYSILDSAEDALLLYKNEKLLSSASIVRALYEREILLYYLCAVVEKIIKDPKNHEEYEKIKQLMFGSKGSFSDIQSINVLTMLNKQIKSEEFKDSKIAFLYEELSNLVHPNYNGVLGLYAKYDMDTSSITFVNHDQGNVGLTILVSINKTIGAAMIWNNKLGEMLHELEDRVGANIG